MNQQTPLTVPQSFPADVPVALTFDPPSLAALGARAVFVTSASGVNKGVFFVAGSEVSPVGIGVDPSTGKAMCLVHFASAPTTPPLPPGSTAALTLQVYTL